ncbi:MAG: tripartite tricarboxylate transporter substrate binding protein [Burkholderiales bacterium]|nr:tripartite tricarboxylate transporter substrate binding protein [Burkholderiales bacterium]
MRHEIRVVALACAVAGLASAGAHAQGFASRPVRLVVPWAAGGTVDTVGRAIAPKLTEMWKQPVVVENRAGAGGNIGADAVTKAAPDGHTILVGITALAISAALYKQLPFDPVKDLAPASQMTASFTVLVVHPSVPAQNVREFVALAKSQPGKLNYGSTGPGSPPHLTMELFKSATGINLLHVPYKGDAFQIPALLAGEVQAAITPLAAAIGHIKAGKLRVLAMTGAKRSAVIPDVPTVVEAGVPGFVEQGWLGLFLPSATPREVVNRISADAARVTHMPDLIARWPGWGYEPVGGKPEEFAAQYRRDIERFSRVIREANIPKLD